MLTYSSPKHSGWQEQRFGSQAAKQVSGMAFFEWLICFVSGFSLRINEVPSLAQARGFRGSEIAHILLAGTGINHDVIFQRLPGLSYLSVACSSAK